MLFVGEGGKTEDVCRFWCGGGWVASCAVVSRWRQFEAALSCRR